MVADRPQALPPDVRDGAKDEKRRAVLAALKLMDSGADPDFDRLAKLAASLFDAPVGLVTIVDAERQWFKARHGTELQDTPTDIAFCAYTIASAEPALMVRDTAADPRFKDNPLVAGDEHIRFYAGAPIVVKGEPVGTVCVLDRVAHPDGDPARLEQLRSLADIASSLFALKHEAQVRAQTAAELIREEWRHALTLEAGKVGSWIWDIRSGEMVVNDILRRMFGIDPVKPVVIDDIFAAIAPDHVDKVKAALQATFNDGLDYSIEFKVRSGRWLIARGRVYQRDAAGKPLVMMGVHIDTTETRESADRTRLLLRELNHRVKNTLAMIQSLARQTLRQSASQQGFIDAFSGRLRTLSDAHALLSDRDWSGVGLAEIVTSQVGPYLSEGPQQLRLAGADLHLSPDHALGIGLILHELASNARKFGSLSRRGGTVGVTWSEPDPDGDVTLVWKESGGPEVSAPAQRGFGTRLIERSLDKVLGSTVTLAFPPDGVEARLTFPLAMPTVDQASSSSSLSGAPRLSTK